MLNKCFLTGRPTADPKSHVGEKGDFVSFSLAVNGRKNKDGLTESMFIDCVVSGKQSEIVSKYVKKGTLLTAVGRLYQTRYEDRNGLQHSKIALVIDEVELYGKPEGEALTVKDSAPVAENLQPMKEVEDDLPF